MKVRSGFMGAFAGMSGSVVVWGFVGNLVPLLIWLVALVLVLLFGRADER